MRPCISTAAIGNTNPLVNAWFALFLNFTFQKENWFYHTPSPIQIPLFTIVSFLLFFFCMICKVVNVLTIRNELYTVTHRHTHTRPWFSSLNLNHDAFASEIFFYVHFRCVWIFHNKRKIRQKKCTITRDGKPMIIFKSMTWMSLKHAIICQNIRTPIKIVFWKRKTKRMFYWSSRTKNPRRVFVLAICLKSPEMLHLLFWKN